jgi:hypothetical protein
VKEFKLKHSAAILCPHPTSCLKGPGLCIYMEVMTRAKGLKDV